MDEGVGGFGGLRGTNIAASRGMAAVLCLVMLPLMAAVGFMFGVVQSESTFSSVMCGITFVLLGGGMFFGMFRMARGWEEEKLH